ncbi:MAG: DUF4328 domain-containing protein [Flavobacteriales bacterium]|nr:DUF4328 domain-containing protein [Flavobacteriales bacterium]
MEQRLRPNAQRSRNAITWLWIMVGVEVLMLLVNYRHLALLQRIQQGERLTERSIDNSDIAMGLASLLYLVAFIFTAITFIKWFRRAFYNLQRRTTGLQHTEEWAAAAWFIPVLNLFKPYRIMHELYARTIKLLGASSASSAHVGWWWTFWVLTGILGQVAFRLDMWAEDPEELILSTKFAMAEACIGIPAALLALSVVQRYAAMEPMMAALATPPPGAPRTDVPGSSSEGSVVN